MEVGLFQIIKKIGSSLSSIWLKEDGLSRSTIGWAGLIFSVYAFNYLWAPLVDIKVPILSKKIGHRKSWIFCMQTLIIICLILYRPQLIQLITYVGYTNWTFNCYLI